MDHHHQQWSCPYVFKIKKLHFFFVRKEESETHDITSVALEARSSLKCPKGREAVEEMRIVA
ncbi:unnamed protein product [Arabis nemorensis]|uniref:Uncharacterized protein n=1 Tax=Arabis nemorensis TaxID=586526 RepID=A0A565CI90_9BRAS|nr:unnamed protein product [Arabis nemorensis]